MSNKSLIVRLTGLALMMTLPVMAFAQTSRVEGMALQGDYIKDYTGIFTYLSSVPTVGNLVYSELGTGSPNPVDRSVGAVLGNLWDGHFGTWAINLRSQTAQLGQGDQASTTGAAGTNLGGDKNSNFNESFDLMWGKKLGNANLGLRVNRSYYQNKLVTGGVTTNLEFDPTTPPVDPNLRRNIMGYGAGIGLELNQNSSVEISGLLESRTFENSVTAPASSNKDDGGSTYQLAGRMMWQWTPSVMVTPVVKLYNFDLSRRTLTTAFDNKMSGWQAGLAGNWTVGTSDLFVLGATVAQNRLEESEDLFGYAATYGANPNMKLTESLTPLVFAGLETHVNRWLTLRFGANKGAFQKTKIENQGGAPAFTREISVSSFRMNLGAGVKLGTLQLDALMANNFPQTLGWVGSGNAGAYFPKVTATYAF